ncbi:DUF2715 domain-containing protein [Treponema denticola]|uniref:Outer membrane protein beta-barrel domain-containing protein n=1 Tax=Treponema denticola SP33 TaxID=999437 RepID=M2BWH3_TREDN|nr:DUF2715 domain-containing protein [Treponema denticola]EMB25853.1 hypothetical protein HMPREF9733_00985 [Treponema denticola SP33]EPF36887.1 hypothetical protein HMPREF9732_00914 [Treponema denticola SP32]
MKNKKIIFILIISVASAVFAFADFAISFGPAFTNYFVHTKNNGNLGTVHADIQKAVQELKDEKNNAAGLAVDLRAGFIYLMAQIAFPGKNHTDLMKGATAEKDKFVVKNAFILDTQLGAGITLFKKTRFNLFLGGGLGLNAMKATQSISIAGQNLSYDKLDVMFGVGVNVLASFYFTKMIGIYGGIADTVYFAPLKVEKTFNVAGQPYTFSNKNSIQDVIANSVNLKLGLSIRL